jgi:hypothetical protein
MAQHKKTTIGLTRTLLISSLLLLLVLYLLWSKGLPWLANHYQFALPGENGLPYEISYKNWSYQNLATCATADWCEVNQNPAYYKDYPVCMREADIKKANQWPLVQIASMWTLGESPQPILVDETHREPTAGHIVGGGVIYVHRKDGCYTQYTMTSGP